MKTFLEGYQLHEGWRPTEAGCTLVEKEEKEENKIVGFTQTCEQGEGEGVLGSKLVTNRQMSLQYKTEGRTIERMEQRELSTKLRPEVGLITISTTTLTVLDDVDVTTEYNNIAFEGEHGKELGTIKDEEDAEVLMEKGKKLLVTLSKTKAGTVEAASNFLHLRAFLDTLNAVSTEAFLKKFKTKKAFKHVVEAAAGSKSPFLQAAVFDIVVSDKKKKHLLERFLIGVSFTQPREDVVKELLKRLGDVDEEARETMLLAACKLQGGLVRWGELLELAGESCSSPSCHRTLTNCLLAAGKEGRESELVDLVRNGEGVAGERALVALGKNGIVGKTRVREVERLLMEKLMNESSTFEQKVAALSSISIGDIPGWLLSVTSCFKLQIFKCNFVTFHSPPDNGTVDFLLPIARSKKNTELASLVSQVLKITYIVRVSYRTLFQGAHVRSLKRQEPQVVAFFELLGFCRTTSSVNASPAGGEQSVPATRFSSLCISAGKHRRLQFPGGDESGRVEEDSLCPPKPWRGEARGFPPFHKGGRPLGRAWGGGGGGRQGRKCFGGTQSSGLASPSIHTIFIHG